MARQILFRGRKGNIWCFGDLLHDDAGRCGREKGGAIIWKM